MKINFIPLQKHGDDRGSLVALEEENNIPFSIKRVYYIFDTKEGVRRGFHAHKKLKQVAIAVKGSCRFLLDDGTERIEVVLDNPAQGLLIESCIWREMYDFSSDCVLMVLADSHYDENDYIRDYDAFIIHANAKTDIKRL
jgi:dTDP-4-dehydrorhamnose 3,5-epimerase-like enzyme